MMKMRMGPDPGEIASTLGLSTDQKVQWDSIHQQLQASVEPLHQQLSRRARAAGVARVVVESRRHRRRLASLAARAIEKQLKAAHESAHQKLTAILTPDQKAKFDSLHHEMAGHGPMEMHMRHPEPGSRD